MSPINLPWYLTFINLIKQLNVDRERVITSVFSYAQNVGSSISSLRVNTNHRIASMSVNDSRREIIYRLTKVNWKTILPT